MHFRLIPVCLILLLAACNSGTAGFMGVPAQTVTVAQSTFDVRRKDDLVEVVRTNREAVFSLTAIIPRAEQAVVAATGCAPRPGTWTGDQVVARVRIDCAD
ncbi:MULTISPECIES: hypothetical protein [unclassified Yoonia]|uniref:hypothetical protein n=1 Tax=unclassified Yoonia TaxID=2629118 RepID=UPI002AFDF946|nr:MULTISPECIES: hypothetical protein [unclassified Yoonia]